MKTIVTTALLIFCSFTYAQIAYYPGYFISSDGSRTDCFIRDMDWKNNPTEFDYRNSESGQSQTASIADVQSFVITGRATYVRSTVQMDMSKDALSGLSYSRNPEFEEKTIFLEQLVDGDAKLYYFEDDSRKRFFYQVGVGQISQLVYKRYKVDKDGQTGLLKNNAYQQYLWNDLKCESITKDEALDVAYTQKELVRFFQRYNVCKDPNYVIPESSKGDRKLFNLYVKGGIRNSSFLVDGGTQFRGLINSDFGSQTTLKLGLGFEFLMASNAGKWAFFIDPSYQYFKAEKEINVTIINTLFQDTAFVEYKTFEFPIGIRHYFFLNDDSKIFASLAYTFGMPIDSFLENNRLGNEVINAFKGNFGFGVGYSFKEQFSLEAMYELTRSPLSSVGSSLATDFNSISFTFGYKLL